ncbi:MAG: 3-dehydroquinate synthase family protein [Oscillospiraceae bacterium]
MKLTMELGPRSYDIVLKKGSLGRAGKLCNLNRKVLVVSDSGVPAKYVKSLVAQCAEGSSIVVPQGEGSKSVQGWQTLLSRMLALGFGRGDAVAAVGGGVVGDLAGFAAAAYMRGISYFQFPTTTLSQIDSSIGGKVAINLDGTKNIVGAFHQPELVVVDPETLATLPKRHFANGLAEAVKAGLIGNAHLFELFEQDRIEQNLEEILYLSLLYKKGVVERDETEQGERKLLNFGHTIGHGIEAACGLGEGENGLLHGECVALGMLPMIESRTLQRRTRAILKKLGLPLAYHCSADEILKHMHNDKKRSKDKYTIVRVKTLGEGYLETVDFEELSLLVKGATA